MAINSSGTLVGAVLESAGYIYQATLLDSLTAPLKDEVGALIYLLGVAIVIFQYTVLKSAKMAPWLLIGPAVFSAVILDRSDIQQAKWSFGSSERDQGEVTDKTEKVTDGQSGSANVSTLFRRFVTMSSEVTRAMVDTINGVQIKNDLWFIAKGQMVGAMTNFKEEDPGLQGLIHYGLSGHCFDVIQAARSVNNPLYRFNVELPNEAQGAVDDARNYWLPTRAEAERVYNELLILPEHSFQNNKRVLEYIKQLQFTQAVVNASLGATFAPFMPNLFGDFAGYVAIQDDTKFSCKQIWQFTLMGILEKANIIEQDLEKKAEDLGIEKTAIRNLLGQATGMQGGQLLSSNSTSAIGAEDIARVIAKYLFRNETRTTEIGSQIARFAGRHDIRKLDTRLEGDFSSSERDRLGVQEWSEKERLAHAAYSMPVYQGLMLYFLGMTFPFFALLLLIPGKATGFLTWFALWIWAKSWDIGLAIVMQLDTIFWSLYAVQKQRMGGNDFIPDDLSTAMVALEQMDPTFQMGSYYTLLAVCVLAIPPVTANLILGSMRAGSGIISAGINQFSDFYATNMASRVQQGAITILKNDSAALKDLRGLSYALGGGSKDALLEGRQGRGLQQSGSAQQSGSVGRARQQNGVFPNQTDLSRGVEYPSATTPKHMDRRQMQANVDAMTRINRAQGIEQPLNVLGGAYKGISQQLLSGYNLGALTIEQAAANSQFKVLMSQAASENAQAEFEGSVDAVAYELHKRLAHFGAIPVPWVTKDDDGSGKEVDRHLAEFDMRMNMLKSYADFVSDGTDIALKSYGELMTIGENDKKKEEKDESNALMRQFGRTALGIGAGFMFDSDAAYSMFGVERDTSYLAIENAEEKQLAFQKAQEKYEEDKRKFDDQIPDYIKEDLVNYVKSVEYQTYDPNDPNAINKRRHIDMEWGGDLNELIQGPGEGQVRRSMREQFGKKKNNALLYHPEE